LQQDYIGLNEAGWKRRLPFFEALEKNNPTLAADLEDRLCNVFKDSGHKIGGYLYTTQYDPRGEECRDWQLLFQMDSDRKIMWGDVGVANFFIHPDRLRARDFSTVLYSWDCC
jgi:uncharacterized protein YwqG